MRCSEPFDAVVVIGSRFADPNGTSERLDRRGEARLAKAIRLVKSGMAANLVLTGQLPHRTWETSITFAEKCEEIAWKAGVPPKRILLAPKGFSLDTKGDVQQALHLAQKRGWEKLLFVTEEPHALRVGYFFKKLNPRIIAKFERCGIYAPPWYWAKELIGYALLKRFGEDSRIYRFSDRVYEKFQA